jgi:anaerobic selenocysteine-containing dehydrogenase
MFILSNPLVSWPNSKETYRALMKLDLIVVSELFMTPTTALADIVLPAAWSMEHKNWDTGVMVRGNPRASQAGRCSGMLAGHENHQ